MRLASKARELWLRVRFPDRALHLILPVVVFIPAAVIFDAVGVIKQVEEPLVRVIAHQVEPQKSPVAVVQISDEDFRQIFHSNRPLSPDKIARVIDSIVTLGARAIAVDIDTSHPDYKVLAGRKWFTPATPSVATGTTMEVPVVWARRASYSNRAGFFYTEEVLGGAGSPLTAVATVTADSDKAVRRYRRSFSTDRGKLLALPIELLKAAGMMRPGGEDGERTINYYGHTSGTQRVHFWTGAVLQAAADRDIAATRPLRDKIVFFGGAFRGIDEHETPLGWMRGVELLAHIAETDAGNAAPTARSVLNVIVIIGACLIAICFAKLRAWTAVLVALIAMLFGLLFSWWYTHGIRDALLVGATFIVIVCQQLYAKMKEVVKAKAKEQETSPDCIGAEVDG